MKTKNRKHKKGFVLPMMIILFAVIFSTFFITKNKSYENYDWTGIRSEIKDTLINFCNDHYDITSHGVGEMGKTPSQWHRYTFLRKNISYKEALLLKNFPKSKVKAIAYEICIRKKPQATYSIMLEALNDTVTHLEYQSGCIGRTYLLAEYLNIQVSHLGLDSSSRNPIIDNPEKLIGMEEYNHLDSLYNYRVSKKWDYIKY